MLPPNNPPLSFLISFFSGSIKYDLLLTICTSFREEDRVHFSERLYLQEKEEFISQGLLRPCKTRENEEWYRLHPTLGKSLRSTGPFTEQTIDIAIEIFLAYCEEIGNEVYALIKKEESESMNLALQIMTREELNFLLALKMATEKHLSFFPYFLALSTYWKQIRQEDKAITLFSTLLKDVLNYPISVWPDYFFSEIISLVDMMATMALRVRDFNAAYQYYQLAIDLFEQSEEEKKRYPLGLALFYEGMGNATLESGNLQEAEELYLQALHLYHENQSPRNMASIHQNLGLVALSKEDYHLAIHYFQQALPIFIQIDEQLSVARLYGNLGVAFMDLAKFSKAETYLRSALEIYQTNQDTFNQGLVYQNIGNLHLAQQEFLQAEEAYQKAVEIFFLAHAVYEQAQVLGNLGVLSFTTNHFKEAVDYYRRGINIYLSLTDQPNLAQAYQNLGNALFRLEQFEECEQAHQQALSIYEQLGWNHISCEVKMNLGNLALVTGDLSKAVRQYRSAFQDFCTFEKWIFMPDLLTNVFFLGEAKKDYSLIQEFYRNLSGKVPSETLAKIRYSLPKEAQKIVNTDPLGE